MNVVIIGPAHPLRGGGLASFNERLARAFQTEGHEVELYTFSLQYPSFLFPGTTQYSTDPPPTDIRIKVCINSVSPANWFNVGKELKAKKPDIIVLRYWLPFMAPCLGTIARIAKKNKHTKIVCIADNIIPHEHFPFQTLLTKYLVGSVDGFITMSDSVMQDLRRFTSKRAIKAIHPLYDNFGEALSQEEARKYLDLPLDMSLVLFFGFIRKYKGLDLLLEAMYILQEKKSPIKLLVAGEYYGDKKLYDDIIANYQLQNIILRTDFIPDSQVKYYLSAVDFVIQPYREATQSGVTPLAYHFEKPMLVTNVGGLADMVPDGKVGLVCKPDPISIADTIEKLYTIGSQHFIPFLKSEKIKYNWATLVHAIVDIAQIN